MFSVTVGEYILFCNPEGLPDSYSFYRQRAALVEEIGIKESEGKTCFLSARRGQEEWPFLVIAQRYNPAGYGFYPGIMLVPETDLLFLGAGARLLAYRLDPPERLWEDVADMGFWYWARFEDVIVMSAELEMAAWDIHGHKLWSTFVEPPWHYTVSDEEVLLSIMGRKTTFSLRTGP